MDAAPILVMRCSWCDYFLISVVALYQQHPLTHITLLHSHTLTRSHAHSFTLSLFLSQQVTEEFLKQLGNRPLAAALSDLDKLLSATTSDSSDSSSSGPDSAAALRLARGIQLQPEGSAALEKLGELLSEIQVADAVMKLDLGPDISKTLDMLAGKRV